MTKAGETADDLTLRDLTNDDWRVIFALTFPPQGRRLLERLSSNGNQPIKVRSAGYCYYSAGINKLNRQLHLCGETGYYLKRADDEKWNNTSLQLYVRNVR